MTKPAHYEVTNYVGMWWDKKKWTSKPKGGTSSHRIMRNGKEAWKHYKEMGPGFVLLKFFYKGGKYLIQEWMNYPPEAAAIFAQCKKCRKEGCCKNCWSKILPYLKDRKD